MSIDNPARSESLVNPTKMQQFCLDRTSTWNEYNAALKVLAAWQENQEGEANFVKRVREIIAFSIEKEKEEGGLLYHMGFGK